MMKSVGAYQAKTNLPKLLEAVRGGETVTITRHGHPVAVLHSVERSRDRAKVADALRALAQFRKGRTLGLELRAAIEVGRR